VIELRLVFVGALALLGCSAASGSTRRRDWGVRVPIQDGILAQSCLRNALATRFGELHRSTVGYQKVDSYLRSPVKYGPPHRDDWILVSEETLQSGRYLSFSDDWVGPRVQNEQMRELANELKATASSIAAQCGLILRSNATRCETFPPGEPCPW
jgi:hypothetical protein